MTAADGYERTKIIYLISSGHLFAMEDIKQSENVPASSTEPNESSFTASSSSAESSYHEASQPEIE